MRARREALQRELDELDASLERRERTARELAALDRSLRETRAPRPWRIFAVSLVRSAASFVPGFALGALVFGLPTFAMPSRVIVAHDTPSVVALAGQRFVVARSVIDRLVATHGAGARLEPYVDGDAIVGLRVASFAPASELAELGLREGDIIVAVDDHAIGAPDGARDAFATLRTAWSFEIVIRRDKRERRIGYEVVG